jgi:cyclophilin family peptidyl-prolyl cis-trans isomerase
MGCVGGVVTRNRRRILSGLHVAVFASAVFASIAFAEMPVSRFETEGKLLQVTVTSAPFEIGKRYKSMQGPSITAAIKLEDLVAAGGNYQITEAPSEGTATHFLSTHAKLPSAPDGTELWWFRGAKVEVIDADSDKVGSIEFLCHSNIDLDSAHRKKLFPLDPGFSDRLVTFTAGQSEFILPPGYGIPVASEETWRFTFQALNQNLPGAHRFRHRMTVYFSRQRDLSVPLRAASWTVAWVAVPLDGNGEASYVCPCCGNLRGGLEAAASTGRYKMKDGRSAAGHWVVPDGREIWHFPMREFSQGLDKDRDLIATWVHVHPFAESVKIKAYDPGCDKPREVWSSRIQNISTGVGLKHVETLSVAEGLRMPATANYDLEVAYNNTSHEKQDAMAMVGLVLTEPDWRLPEWTLVEQKGNLFCGAPSPQLQTATTSRATPAKSPSERALFRRLSPYSGPRLKPEESYEVEMQTTQGSLRFRVEPSWAPVTASALKPIFENNLYSGLIIRRADRGFLIQIPEVLPTNLAKEDDRTLLCRLPAEPRDDVKHRPGTLSMAMWVDEKDSATTSFSFILGNAGHLDGKFTVFGQLEDFESARTVLENIVSATENGEKTRILGTQLVTLPKN